MIKAYIFDQDGTLYPNKSTLTDVLRERTKHWISERLNLDKKEVDRLYASLPEQFPHPFHGFLSLGLSPEEYHKEVFDKVDLASYLTKNGRLKRLFDNIQVPKFVVTFASINYSYKLQARLGIEGLIEKTLPAIAYPPTYSKSKAYNSIREELCLNASEICVVGDNFVTDILPAMENGFETVLVGRQNKFSGRSIKTIYDLDNLI